MLLDCNFAVVWPSYLKSGDYGIASSCKEFLGNHLGASM